MSSTFDVKIAPAGEKGMGVYTTRAFQKGETVVVGKCLSKSTVRDIYTIQTGADVHVMMDEPAVRINHSFSPNVGVRNNEYDAYDFVALEDIAEGVEISFDYETTESDLTNEFRKCCPAPPGRASEDGSARGFHSLPTTVRERYGEFVANYLKVSSGGVTAGA